MTYDLQVVLTKVFNIARKTKLLVIVGSDFVFSFFVALFSFNFVHDSVLLDSYYLKLSVLAACMRVFVFFMFGLYTKSWRFASSREFKLVYGVVFLGSVFLAVIGFGINFFLDQRINLLPFILLEFMGVFSLVFSFRGFLRLLRDELMIVTKKNKAKTLSPVLVIGAGSAGAMLASENLKNPNFNYDIKGFLDDDITKFNQYIHGVKVLGSIDSLEKYVNLFNVQDVIIAIPSLASNRIRDIVGNYLDTSIRFKITPDLHGLVDGKVRLSQLRDVRIQDLLGRSEVNEMIIDQNNNYIKDKVVLVTGGGGSIGSEICIQLLKFSPARLIVFDNCEDNVYQIDRKIRELFPDFVNLISVVGDVSRSDDLERVFKSHHIDLVFHAAAYKHVPLMEVNIKSLLQNNVFGTKVLLELSTKYLVERFILISTDKAVNPANSMGASKRLCELFTLAYANNYKLNFSVVRFGNVLDSKGSVVPLFREQIAKGGPVTVTHPDITRYFMTIPEASRLVLQAGLLSQGGEVFTLDMGEPIKILDLAKDMIQLSNLNELDVPITFTGLRAGEKMYEELSYNVDTIQKTLHPKIFVDDELSTYMLKDLLSLLDVLVAVDSDLHIVLMQAVNKFKCMV